MWLKFALPRRRASGVRRCCPRSRRARHNLFLERLEDRNVPSNGLSTSLVQLGGATPLPIPLPLALATNPFGGPDIYQNFQGPADANPLVTPLLGNEPNQISNFNGFYGGARVQGTGTDGHGHTLLWDADLRFMKGVYQGLNGNLYSRTFVQV